jgi:hypothetical protein
VLNTDPWLLWYYEYDDRIFATFYGIEADSFGHRQLFPFMNIEILRSALTERERKFYNAADLDKISTILVDNGKPLPDDTQ